MCNSILEVLKIVMCSYVAYETLCIALICVSLFAAVRVQSQSGKDPPGLRKNPLHT